MSQKKKKGVRFLWIWVLLVSLLLPFGTAVEAGAAKNKSYISVSSSSITTGNTLTVRVWGDKRSAFSLRYSTAYLKFESGTANASADSNGKVIFTAKEASLKFTAVKAGTAELIVSADSLKGCSAVVSVSGDAIEDDEEQADSSDEAKDTSEEKAKAEGVTIGTAGRYVTLEKPENLPSNALKKAAFTTDSGERVLGYQFEDASSEFYYIYGTDEESNVGWFAYDVSTHTFARADTSLMSLVSYQKTQEDGKAEPTDTQAEGEGVDSEEEEPSGALAELGAFWKSVQRQVRGNKLLSDRRFLIGLLVGAAVLFLLLLFLFGRRRESKRRQEEEMQRLSEERARHRRVEPSGGVQERVPDEKVWDQEDVTQEAPIRVSMKEDISARAPLRPGAVSRGKPEALDVLDLNDL